MRFNIIIIDRESVDVRSLRLLYYSRRNEYTVHGSFKMYQDWLIFSYFKQFVFNKILAPDVFNHVSSKSESWHRVRNLRSIYEL